DKNSPFAIPNNSTHKTWMTLVLPYVEQDLLYREGVSFYQHRSVNIYVCPSDPRQGQLGTYGGLVPGGFTSYLAVNGARYAAGNGPGNIRFPCDGVLYGSSRTRIEDIADGASAT